MSKTRTLTLADFLLARIAEDENAARANEPESERYPYGDRLFAPTPFERLGGDLDDYLGGPLGAHAARWHPARVLAECEAKRRIIAKHAPGPCETLRLLALPYADHPDYRPKWRA